MENRLTTSLSGLNALVCGSTSGIGQSTALEFATLGANVTLFARNEEKQNKTLSSLQNFDRQKHQYLLGDFNTFSTIQEIMKSHISSGNKYHILINNSGGPKGGPIVEADASENDSKNWSALCCLNFSVMIADIVKNPLVYLYNNLYRYSCCTL